MVTRNWYPEKIKKFHVRKAAKIWGEEKKYLNFRNSTSYDVIINNSPYPPKAISSIAHQLATGIELRAEDFAGARDGTWHRCLKRLGFDVVEKGSDSALSYEVSKSLKLSSSKRLALIAEQTINPPQEVKVQISRFLRNRHVVAERLFRANGKCEECKKKAPFLRLSDQRPYLEVHHIVPLSDGGLDTLENTQALCPNCHCKIHDQLRMNIEIE